MSDETTPSANDGGEPSMEDILASIRRIIADDEQGGEIEAGDIAETVVDAPVTDIPSLTLVDTVDDADMMADLVDNNLTDIDLTDDTSADVLDLSTGDMAPLDDGFGDENLADNTRIDELDELSAEINAIQSQTPKTAENLDIAAFDDTDLDLELLLDSDEDIQDALEIPDVDVPVAEMTESKVVAEESDFALLDDIDLLVAEPVPDLDDSLLEDLMADASISDDVIPDEMVIDPAADLIASDGAHDGDDTGALIDSLLGDDFEPSVAEAERVSETVSTEPLMAAPVSATADSDLELVKSLMADLTDDSFLDDKSDHIAEADVDVQSRADEAALNDLIEASADEEDVLDDILSLTLDEEAALQDETLDTLFEDNAAMDDAPAADVHDGFVPDDILPEEFAAETASNNAALSETSESAHKSLADIAAEAQQDALDAEGSQTQPQNDTDTGDGAMLAAVLAAAAGTAGAAALSSQDSAPEDDAETSHEDLEDLIMSGDALSDDAELETIEATDDLDDMLMDLDVPSDAADADGISTAALDIDDETDNTESELTEISPQNPSDGDLQETAAMARVRSSAAKKDTILDEVTETATASAFAELNTAVEEKAVIAERGDRIGDLVQEALRPMLKEWLDANLKGIVERAVTKEVKRIASGK